MKGCDNIFLNYRRRMGEGGVTKNSKYIIPRKRVTDTQPDTVIVQYVIGRN